MKRSKQFLKRAVSMLLVFTMVLSMIPVVHAHAEETEPTTTLTDLIVKNYENLSAEEKTLLQAGVLKDNTIVYHAPTQEDSDSLVSVTSADKTVTAKIYEDEDGNLWIPVSFAVSVGEDVKEMVALSKSGSVYVGMFTGDYEAYNIDVTYQLQWTVEHGALLNAAYYLTEDYEALLALKAEAITTLLSGLELSNAETGNMAAIELIAQMANGGYELDVPGAFGDYLTGVDTTLVITGEETKNASAALVNSMVNGKLPLSSYTNQTTLKWLTTDDRESLFDAIVDSYENVLAMANDPNGVGIIGEQIQDLIDACEDADATIVSAINDKVGELNSAIGTLNNKIAELNSKIEELNTKIADLNNQLPEGQEAIAAIGTIQPVSTVTVNTAGMDAQTALTEIDSALGTVATALNTLGTELDGLNSDLTGLNSRIGDVINEIDNTVADAEEKMAEAYTEMNEKIDEINEQLDEGDKIEHVDSVQDVRDLKGKLQAQADKVYDAIEKVAADNEQTITIKNADDVAELKDELTKKYTELLDTINDELAEANASVRLYMGTADYFNANVKSSDELEPEIVKMQDLVRSFPELANAVTTLNEAKDALEAIEEATVQIDDNISNLEQLDAAIGAVDTALNGPNGNDGLEAAEDALEEAAGYKTKLQNAQDQLNTAENQLEPAKQEIANAQTTITNARGDITAAKEALLELPDKVVAMKDMQKVINKLPGLMEDFCEALENTYLRTKNGAWYLDKNQDILAANVDYAVLNEKVAAAVGKTELRTAKDALDVTKATVRSNVGTVNVTVKVVASVVDSNNNPLDLSWTSEIISVTEGTTKETLLEKLAELDVEATGLATFDPYYNVGAENYQRGVSALPETLTEDVTYEITYEPKKMYVTQTWEEGAEQRIAKDYGALYVLRPHQDIAKGYVYTVTTGSDSQTLYQGNAIRVLSDMTITRTEGDAMTPFHLEDLLTKTHTVETAVEALLNSGALHKGRQVLLRVPGDLAVVEGNTITVPDYPAGLGNLVWVATSAKATLNGGGTEDVALIAKNGSHEGTIQGLWTKVDIYYTLTFTHSDLGVTQNELETALLLPYVLHEEYTEQKRMLDELAASASELKVLDAEMIGTLQLAKGQLDTSAAAGAVDTIIERINAGGGMLMLANLADQYKNGGMAFYYGQDENNTNNSSKFISEINIMCEAMNALLADPKFETLWSSQDPSVTGGKTYADLLEISGTLNNLELRAPHKAINTGAASLNVLVDALESIEAPVSSVNAPLTWTETMSRTGANYSSVNVAVSYKGQTLTSEAITVVKGSALSQEDYNKLAGYLTAMETTLGVDKTHYVVSGALPEVGTAIGTDTTASIAWTAKTYTVKIEGEADQTITYDNRTVQLPACNQDGHRYDYTIDGETVRAGKYTFSADKFDALFATGTYTITRKLVNIADEKMASLVNEMGDAATLSKDAEGNYAIVVPINPDTAKEDLTSFVMGLLLGNQYNYIGMKTGEQLVSLLEGDATQIVPMIEPFFAGGKYYLQTLVNGIADSGIGSDTVLGVINADGSINHLNLAGNTVLVGAEGETLTALGGKVLELPLYFGEDDENNVPVKLYLTINGAPDELTKVRNGIDKVKQYVQFACEDGRYQLNVTLPELAYEAYLALLLVKGEVDIRHFEQMNAVTAFGWIMELMDGVLEDPDVTLETYVNTVEKFGTSIERDLSKYEDTYKKIVGYYNAAKDGMHEEQDGWYIDPVINIDNVIDTQLQKLVDQAAAGMNLPAGTLSLAKMIAEYGTEGITFTASAKLTNINTSYDALVFDIQKAEVKKLAGLEENLVANAPSLSGYASVTLLRDVAVPDGEKLTFNTTTVLDLNGYTITGDIVANGTLIITDSRVGSNNAGTITGAVSGSNVMINGGHYPNCDVMAYLKDGFAQDVQTGLVSSTLYTVSKTAAAEGAGYDDEIVITVNASAAELRKAANKKSLALIALDAVLDVALTYYNSANFYVEGNKVFDISVDDAVDLVSGSDRMEKLINEGLRFISAADMADLVNLFTADLTDFAALKDAIDNGTAVAGYEFSVAPWDFQISRTEEDYITAGIGGIATNAQTGKISIIVDGAQKDAISTVLGAFADTIDVELQLAMQDLQLSGTSLPVVGEVNGSLVADFSHDANYVIMMAVILANSADDALKNQLVAAVEEYYGSNSLAEMEAVFNTISVEDLCMALRSNGNFAAMVETLPLKAATKQAIKSEIDDTEKGYYAVIEAVGRVLTRLDITGTEELLNGKTLGDVKKTEKKTNAATQEEMDVNYYGISKSKAYTKSANLPGDYTMDASINVTDLSLKLYLFTDIARINVACNGAVKEYEDLEEALKHTSAAHANCTVYINLAQTELKNDVTLDHDMSIVHANRIAAGSKKIKLETGKTLTTDAKLPADMVVAVEADKYVISCKEIAGGYAYAAVENQVHVVGPNGELLYSGDDLAAAMQAAVDNSKITVTEEMALESDVVISDKALELVNAREVDFGESTITLDGTAQLVTDTALPEGVVIAADAERYTITCTQENGGYVYRLRENSVHVNGTDELLYSGEDLAAALAAAEAGSVLQVNRDMSLNADVTVNVGISIEGAEDIDFGSYKIKLGADGVVTADADIAAAVVAADPARYKVVCQEEANGTYTYTVLENAVHVTRGGTLLYSGDDLMEAFTKATNTDGSTITVNRPVTLAQQVTLTGVTVTIVGADKITFQSKIILGMNAATIIADADISAYVISGLADRYVLNANNIYSLAKYPYQVGNSYYLTLQSAIDSIQTSGTVSVYSNEAALNGAITVAGKQIAIVNAERLRVDQTSLRITLSKLGDSVNMDALPAGVSAQEMKVCFVNGAGTCTAVEVTVDTGVTAVVVIKHENVTAVSAKGASCTETGNIAYWHCAACGKYYSDAACSNEISQAQTVIGKLAHKFTAETVHADYLKSAATATSPAVYYKSCAVCGESSKGTAFEATFTYGSPLDVAPTITKPVISGTSALVYGSKIDTDNKRLYLDLHKNGITVEELMAALSAQMTNDSDSKPEITVALTASFNNKVLICTGSTVTLTAENASGQKASITYSIVVMGDTNSNGRVESNDSLRMSLHYVKKQELTGLQLLAADNNQNGRIESNDALKNAIKFTGRAQHVTGLKG